MAFDVPQLLQPCMCVVGEGPQHIGQAFKTKLPKAQHALHVLQGYFHINFFVPKRGLSIQVGIASATVKQS
jgi:hypothetical protein